VRSIVSFSFKTFVSFVVEIPHHEEHEAHEVDLLRRNKAGVLRYSNHFSDHRLGRLGSSGEQAMLGKKFDHKAIKKPGLLYLTSVAGSRQNL
jgi:hypothetical protein